MKLLGLKRDNERYVFLYDDVSVMQLLAVLGRYAAASVTELFRICTFWLVGR